MEKERCPTCRQVVRKTPLDGLSRDDLVNLSAAWDLAFGDRWKTPEEIVAVPEIRTSLSYIRQIREAVSELRAASILMGSICMALLRQEEFVPGFAIEKKDTVGRARYRLIRKY